MTYTEYIKHYSEYEIWENPYNTIYKYKLNRGSSRVIGYLTDKLELI